MSQELLYTSAPRGLKPGSRGFCTVLSTQGMPAPLASAVESLSGYRPIYPASDERAARNPVVYSHLKMQATGRTWHVLSRIADYGLDYSQRANKLAHHVILDDPSERLPGGPANLISMPGFMREEWSDEPKVVALKPVTREPRAPSGICRRWQEMTGDAGWAGVLAESFLKDPDRLVILLFAPGQEILPLFAEALSLLPPNRRWDVTFSTYFTGLATGTTCLWRAVVHDTKEAHESLRFVNALRIDLTSDSLGTAAGGELVEAARSEERTVFPPNRGTPPKSAGEDSITGSEHPDEEFAAYETEQVVEFAGITQTPPRRIPSVPEVLTTSIPPNKRSGTRLADVIEAESRRPHPLRRWRTTITAAILAITTCILALLPHLRSRPSNDSSQLASKSLASEKTDDAVTNSTTPAPQTDPPLPKELPHAKKASVEKQQEPSNKEAVEVSATLTSNESTPAEQNNESRADIGNDPHVSEDISGTPPPTHEHSKATLRSLPTADEQQTVLLCEFDITAEQSSLYINDSSKIRLFKPTWLTYVDTTPTDFQRKENSAHRAIGFTAGTETARTALITRSLSNSSVTYKLKPIKHEHIKWLGWYRIQVVPPNANEPMTEIKFADFPLTNEHLSRNFKNNAVSWVLPDSITVDKSTKPQLLIDRITLSIGDREYKLKPSDSIPSSEWTINVDDFDSITLKKFNLPPGGKNAGKLKLILKVEVNTNEHASLIFKLGDKDVSLNQIKTALNAELQTKKRSFSSSYEKIKEISGESNQPSSRQIDLKLDSISIDSLSKEGNMKASQSKLASEIEKVKTRIEEPSNKDKGEEVKLFKAFVSELEKLQEVCERIITYNVIAESLDHAAIRSARIYYEVTDTSKKANGPETKFTVDVVDFDDTISPAERK